MNTINLAAFTAILFLSISFENSMTKVKNSAEYSVLVTGSSTDLAINEFKVHNRCLENTTLWLREYN